MPDPAGLTRQLLDVRKRCDAAAFDAVPDANATLRLELQSLSGCIVSALREMGEVEVQTILQFHVPTATDQLDAIVSHMQSATEAILEECEKLDLAAANTRSRPDVSAATARIYEACSFQDMIGQRVAKVIQVLRVIEAKSAEILRVMGDGPAPAARPPSAPRLLNGPQHPHVAMSQAAVDDLIGGLS